LATMLGGYGIKPKTVRLGAFETPKGYDRDQFKDAFSRYLTTQHNALPEAVQAGSTEIADNVEQFTYIPGVRPRRNPLSDASDTQFLQEPVSSPKPSTPSAATTKLWEAVERAHVAEDAPRVPFDKRPDSDF